LIELFNRNASTSKWHQSCLYLICFSARCGKTCNASTQVEPRTFQSAIIRVARANAYKRSVRARRSPSSMAKPSRAHDGRSRCADGSTIFGVCNGSMIPSARMRRFAARDCSFSATPRHNLRTLKPKSSTAAAQPVQFQARFKGVRASNTQSCGALSCSDASLPAAHAPSDCSPSSP